MSNIPMQRRDILRLLATGTVLQLAPTKLFAVLQEARSLVQAHTSSQTLNAHQYDTVKVMAEIIIPRTDTPGATDVGTADFIDLVLSEWYDEPEQKRFFDGLGDVDSRANNLFGKDFFDCAPAQQENILAVLGDKMTDDSKAFSSSGRSRSLRGYSRNSSFYPMFRRLTLTAYYTSEAGATDELHFEMIPGEYRGCPEPAHAEPNHAEPAPARPAIEEVPEHK
ncbi:MAG: gluconate 2-dehydrogenase subunit 3 family protein [Candidatus Sulfotelmatobacter sp.]